MKKVTNFLVFVVILVLVSCAEKNIDKEEEVENWNLLIDMDLSNWDTYLSYKHQIGYDGSKPKDDSGEMVEPLGLNMDGQDVFTSITENDETLIHVSGEIYGCIFTKEEYSNYHFQLKFKWGEKKWTPRKDLLKDSGILYHSIGDHGAEHWRSWMMSQEFQIMEGHTGDYWKQATSAIDIRAYTPEFIMNPMANETQDFLPVGDNEQNPYYCLRSNNYEKPHGEWNTLDLICFEDKSLHIVNGKVVMILKNSRYYDEDGQVQKLTKGKIQLQSEAAELYYKDIKIRDLGELPIEYQKLF